MRRSIAPLLLLTSLLVALAGACRDAEAPPAPTPVATPPVATSEAAARSPYTYDRVLKAREEQALGTPLPVATVVASIDPDAALMAPRHSYSDLVKFYKKQLAATHEVNERRGGTHFEPKNNGGADVYVLKPRRVGAEPRVTIFGDSKGVELPAALRPAPAPANAKSATPAAPAAAERPTVVDSTTGANYTRRVERDAKGREIVVLRPAPEPAKVSTSGDPSAAGGRSASSEAAASSWRFVWKPSPSTLDPRNL